MGIYVGSYSNSPASSSLVFMMPPPIRSCSKCADPLGRVAAISFPFSLCQRHSLLCRRECFRKYFGIMFLLNMFVLHLIDKCCSIWILLFQDTHLETTALTHTIYIDLVHRSPPLLPHIQFFPIPIAAPTHPTNPLGTPADFDTGWRTKHRRKYILKRQQWLILSILTLSSDPPHVYPDI